MTELDQVWSEMLSKAAANAVVSGQHDIADYLRLKATNDAIRSAGVGWLLDTLIDLAGHETRKQKDLEIERKEPHNFSRGHSNLVGTYLEIRHGVRCLSIEAGWARTPRDGVMRNGALAVARVSHFGLPARAVEFRLVHGETLPRWLDETDKTIDSSDLERHLDILLDR
jgi:hypothetical protein